MSEAQPQLDAWPRILAAEPARALPIARFAPRLPSTVDKFPLTLDHPAWMAIFLLDVGKVCQRPAPRISLTPTANCNSFPLRPVFKLSGCPLQRWPCYLRRVELLCLCHSGLFLAIVAHFAVRRPLPFRPASDAPPPNLLGHTPNGQHAPDRPSSVPKTGFPTAGKAAARLRCTLYSLRVLARPRKIQR